MLKRFLFVFCFIFCFPILSFASLPLDQQPLSYEYSSNYFLNEDDGVIHNSWLDLPSPLSLSIVDKNFVSISGSSSLSNFCNFKLMFLSSTGYTPPYLNVFNNMLYNASYSVSSSFFDSYGSSSYSSYLNISAFPYPSIDSKFSRLDWDFSSFSSLFDPPVYSSVSQNQLIFDNRFYSVGSSPVTTWTKSYNPLNSSKSFDYNRLSDFYVGNWSASIIANNSFFNFSFDFVDDYSTLTNHLLSSSTINFSDAYTSALSSGLQDFSFGLTLSDSSLSNLERSISVWVTDDSLIFDNIFPDEQVLNPSRRFDNPLFPLSYSTEFNYGVYYTLVSPYDSSVYGPFLFNSSYDISLLPDISSDYYVSVDVYYQDISLSLTNFRIITGDFWVDDDDSKFLPTLDSSGSASFGSNLNLSTFIYNLDGFSFRPTIYADGTGLNDLDSTLKDINDNLNSGFVSLGDRIDNVNDTLHCIEGTIKDSTKSITDMLDYVQSQVVSSIDDGIDKVINGWNDKEANNLSYLIDSSSSQLGDSVSGIFDILSSSLEQSGWSFPSWDDFSSLFTSFSLINFCLSSVYSFLGGSVAIGLVLSFYFALKALWSIIHRGN